MMVAGDCMGLEFGYSLTERYEYSNNIYRLDNVGPDEQINSFSANILFKQESPRLQVDVLGSGIYRDYYWESFQDDYDLTTKSRVDWKIVPDVFSWHFSDEFRQIPISTLVNDRPDNRQDRNIFSTGPDLHFRFTGDYRLGLSMRYEDEYFEESETDNTRQEFLVTLEHAINSVSTISINGDHRRVQYDNLLLNRNYTEHRAYISYARSMGRTRSGGDLGASRTRPDDIEEISGAYIRFFMSHRLNSRSDAELTYLRRYSDAANFTRTSTSPEFDDETDNGIFLFKELAGSFLFRDGIDFLKFSVVFRERNFQSGDLDRKRAGAVLDYRRSIHPLMMFHIGGAYGSYDYLQIKRADETLDTSAGLTYVLNRSMLLDLSLSGSRRQSSDERVEYREQRGSLSITYMDGAR